MKKVFLLLVAAVFTLLSANAQTGNDLVISAGDAKEITLGDNMNVVFVVAGSQQDNVKLSKELLEKMEVRFSDGSLQLFPLTDLKHETIYIMVNNNVKNVTLGRNTNVRSEGILQNSLDLFIDMGASAVLKTAGKVYAYSLGDFEIIVTKKSIFGGASAGIN